MTLPAIVRLAARAAVTLSISFASLAVALPSHAAPPAIPDEWFFDGANRPAALKALEGKPAPTLEADAWIGTETSVAASKGKVVVVDFWATWCGPCMNAIPENVALVEKHKASGDLVFIGVHDSNAGWESADKVAKEKKINYALAKDKSGGPSAKAFAVQFWPTYVVIDRSGIVRAAGLIPNHVADVVEMLLKEAAPAGDSAGAAGEFPADTFVGGAKRPQSLRAVEGKEPALAEKIAGIDWVANAPAASWTSTWKGAVVALHFTAPLGALSARELERFAALEKEFAAQGVVFAVIVDSKAKRAAVEQMAAAAKLTMPFGLDGERQAPDSESGMTANPYGVARHLLPTTILIDRSGKIRAAGVKSDKAKALIEKLLAEEAR
ncbi:MAG: Thiol-disulfide oxidoreductase ResA [Planctomycetota bacterium]|jgi:thiol-disulfide isomerase/thioredoxin